MEIIKESLDLLKISYTPYNKGIILTDFPVGTYSNLLRSIRENSLPYEVLNTDKGIVINPKENAK